MLIEFSNCIHTIIQLVLFIIRVYAIYEQNKRLLVLLICAVAMMEINAIVCYTTGSLLTMNSYPQVQWLLSIKTIGIDDTYPKALGVNVDCLMASSVTQ